MASSLLHAGQLLLIGMCAVRPALGQVEQRPNEGALGQPEDADDAAESPRPLLHPLVRLTLDHSLLHWRREQHATIETTNTAAVFDEFEYEDGTTWGGRLRVGMALARTSRDPGAQLYVEGAYGQARSLTFGTSFLGQGYEWQSRAAYWAVMTGAEAQLIKRVLALGAGFGVAGVTDTTTTPHDPNLNVTSEQSWGMQGELSLGVHLPGISEFHPGFELFASGFVIPNAGARVGLSFFLEWDGSR